MSKMMKFDPEVSELLADKISVGYADEHGHLLERPVDGARCYVVLGPVPLPVNLRGRTQKFSWYTFARLDSSHDVEQLSPEELIRQLSSSTDLASSALVKGDIRRAEAPLIRFHSCCATGDIFGSMRCECGPQLRRSMQMVLDDGVGAIVYLADHEGRGIGLFAKAAAYMLQDQGFDTYQANRQLGFPDDDRSFAGAAFMINHLRGMGRPIRMISNNPQKKHGIELGGVTVQRMVPLIMGVTRHNRRYMMTKKANGHLLGDAFLEVVESIEVGEAVEPAVLGGKAMVS